MIQQGGGPFDTPFAFGEPNQSVVLAKKPVSIELDGKTYLGQGDVRLDLQPSAGVHIYGDFKDVPGNAPVNLLSGGKQVTSFSVAGKKVSGLWLNVGGDVAQQRMTLKWSPESEPVIAVGDESSEIQRLIFHLFNFKRVLGARRSFDNRGASLEVIEHIDLVSDEWKLELRSLWETRGRVEKLKAEGGYGLTHIGCLQRANGSSFSGKEAEEILDSLRFFFSFAKGTWCEPVCGVGFDKSDNRVWESWASPREPWQQVMSWFDPHHCEQLVNLFPGFMSRCGGEQWREALHEVIYWYINANHSKRGIDAGIILTQSAVERLSFEYTVKDRKLIEGAGFKNLRASDKFRLLFSSLGIPIAITGSVPEMEKLSKQNQWLDTPHALTEVRNTLVHPEHKKRKQLDSILVEAWNLGLWYLELSIMRICRYSGTYSNRLVLGKWTGQVEDVPWTLGKPGGQI